MWRSYVLAGVIGWGCACVGAPSQPASQPVEVAASQPTTQPAADANPPASPPPLKNLLELSEFTLDLGFDGSFDQRRTSVDSRGLVRVDQKQTNRDFRLEETLGLRSSGALFDEKVALFNAAARWGLSQERFEEHRRGPDQHENPHGNVLEYDVGLTLLPRGKLSGDVFAQQLDSRVPRAFQPSLDRTRERYGGNLYLNDATFPMRWSFEHVWDTLTSRTRSLKDDEKRGDDTFRYEATWQIARNHSIRLDYEYTDRNEQYSGTKTKFNTTRNYITLNHVLRFGENDKSSWENLLRYQDEDGDLARDETEFSSRLRLQHTRALATNYAFQYLRDSFQELTTATWRGEVGATHQWGDVLTSTFQVYGLQHQADENADYGEIGGLANLAFSQENALGRFSANASYNHASSDSHDGQRRGIVIAESVTFRDPLSAYLAQRDVDWLSVVVTDANRSRTYLSGRDWVPIRLGRYTALRRVPTGAIVDGQTVLVSYTYQVNDNFSVNRDRFDVRLQQDFKGGLSPYYAATLQDESTQNERFLNYRDRNINRQRMGATYRQKRWSVGLEYEYNDDSIDPYQAVHGNGDWVMWQKANQQLDGKANLSQFWFRGADDQPARDSFLLDLGTTYRYVLARDLEANASAMYRYEDDGLYGTTNGVDLTAALDWKIGLFSLRFEAEYDLLDLTGSSDNSMSFWIKLRRDIPVIAKEPPR
jgi:hypothetical protein